MGTPGRWWWTRSATLALVWGCAACQEPIEVPDCDDGQVGEVCDVYRLVNTRRGEAGLGAYAWNLELALAAQRHAQDMVDNDYFSHESPDGRSFSDRARDAGYDAAPRGENIAAGQRDAESVMMSWMNSDGHRGNILADESNEIGVGLVDFHWVQVFGTRTGP